MKKDKIKIVLMLLLLCCIPNNISYAKTKVPAWASAGKIAHAGGGIKNTSYTNSVEALKQSLKKKKKVVELDFRFSKDGTLVCLHSWSDISGKKLNKKTFLSSKVKKKFTPMTAEKALELLIENGDTYLVVDAKEKDVTKVYKEIDRLCLAYDKMQEEDVETEEEVIAETPTVEKGNAFRKKIIPQLYQKSEYKKIKKIYNYKNWIFTVYKIKPKSDKEFQSLAKFCKKNGIKTMTLPKKTLTNSIVKILQKQKLAIAVHTVNSKKEYEKYRKMGVNIIYTDFL